MTTLFPLFSVDGKIPSVNLMLHNNGQTETLAKKIEGLTIHNKGTSFY
jgi:hypothetical protein